MTADANTLATALAPLGAPPEAVKAATRRLAAPWQRLADLGFQVEIQARALKVQHQGRGYETVIHLSPGGDLGARRALFQSLRGAFGTGRDRYLSWLFRPGPAVTEPFEALRQVIDGCHRLGLPG